MIVQNRHPLLAYILNFGREKANESVAIDFFAELGYCKNVILILIANEKECLFTLVREASGDGESPRQIGNN